MQQWQRLITIIIVIIIIIIVAEGYVKHNLGGPDIGYDKITCNS